MLVIRMLVLGVLALSVALPQTALASAMVTVPAGVKVPLRFVSAVDSRTAKVGQTVRFRIHLNVLSAGRVVIRKEASAQGMVDRVTQPGMAGKNARVHISSIRTTAVDGRTIRLMPVEVSPEMLRQAKDVGGAVAAGGAGLIILGPIGIAAAALVKGGHVSVPAGAVGVSTTAARYQVRVP